MFDYTHISVVFKYILWTLAAPPNYQPKGRVTEGRVCVLVVCVLVYWQPLSYCHACVHERVTVVEQVCCVCVCVCTVLTLLFCVCSGTSAGLKIAAWTKQRLSDLYEAFKAFW